MTQPPADGRPTWTWDPANPPTPPDPSQHTGGDIGGDTGGDTGGENAADLAEPGTGPAPAIDERGNVATGGAAGSLSYQLPPFLRDPDATRVSPNSISVDFPPAYPAPEYAVHEQPQPEYPPTEYPPSEYPPTGYSDATYTQPPYSGSHEYPQNPPTYPIPPQNQSQHQPQNRPPAQSPPAQSPQPVPPLPVSQPTPTPTPRPEALLMPERPPTTSEPASWGWRGTVRRLSGGLFKPSPAPDELADRQARLDIQRSFSRPMTIVVITPKGGAGKTPTTIGLASALGAHRGGYVVGWDDNETRGTLAVRIANSQGQRTTVWDLLGALPTFERADARVGDLGHYVRGQGDAQFDALVSDDNPANMAQIGDEEFHRIHAVLQRFYRQIVVDTGNNVRSLNWQAAVNAADLIVVVTTYQRDVGYSGSWVLDHLTETGREHLASNAVTVLTAADPKPDPTVRRELLEHFGARTRAVVEIPFDPVVALGGPMEWRLLSPESRRAWTRAGAAVVTALASADEQDRRSRH